MICKRYEHEAANHNFGVGCMEIHCRCTAYVPDVESKSAIETDGILLIAVERGRQLSQEGYTLEHDDRHTLGEIADAACCYADFASAQVRGAELEEIKECYFDHMPNDVQWPWEEEGFKPSYDPIRNLVKAGALIAAEIDRLRRRKS
jgi:hypothetical protein